MCYFLTLSVKGKSTPPVPGRFRRHIHFREQKNPSIERLNPDDSRSFIVISGGCSCPLFRRLEETRDDESRDIEKYRKKGWSEAKIQRVLAHRKEPKNPFSGIREDAVELIDELVSQFEKVRVSLHFYHGDLESEEFSLADGGILSNEDFRRRASQFESETTFVVSYAASSRVYSVPIAS